MTKIYDDFVSKNPTLFKLVNLDLFVKVGFLSDDVYTSAKEKIEEYQVEVNNQSAPVLNSATPSASSSVASSSTSQNATSVSSSTTTIV